ncbi:MAG TPA: outer membrane beta-barrel family protein, partial [Chitinophagaceae bacterium]|nr:outer membrane beta-barrel family protein [Chitinophagaceae bacterium]
LAGTADQISRPYWKGQYHTIKTGLDYYFSKKDVAGIVVNTNWGNGSENPTSDSYVRNADGTINYKLNSFGDNTRKNLNITSNFNYKHTFDSTGREITADLDHAYYSNKQTTQLNTQSYDALNNKIGNLVILAGDIPSEINIYSAKLDYLHPFKKGLKMEAGVKTSYVKTDNRVDYLRSNGSGWNVDDRSNHIVYNETINAAYLIFSKSSKKWELTAGLRLENTISKGHQISNDSTFKRDYTNLFPNLGVGYTANEKNQFNFSYSRRISRPDYDDLNPFTFFLDSLTYGQGNPYLQPQFTHNLELSHTYNKFLTTTLNYTQTDDIITELLKQDTEKKVTYQTRDNFSSMKQFGLAVMANIPVRKWWSSNVYVNVYNNHYKGLYQTDPIDVRYTAFTANMNNNFTIGKGWGAELGGWYRGKSPEGLLVADPMGSLNAGITKQIFKKKGSLKLGIRDILYTSQFSGYAKYSDVDVVIGARRDSRQVTLNFNYRFGKSNIAPERRRKGGASDEQNRVKTGN